MKKLFIYFFLFSFILILELDAQHDTLTINRCVELSLENNPMIKVAEAGYELSESNYSSNQANLFPQVSFQSAFGRNGGTFFSGPITRVSTYENYSLGFQASQLVFDFWKTYSRASAYSDLSDASFQDLKSVQQNIILNVYSVYLNYLQSKRLYDLNIEIQKQAKEHLRQAKASYEIGKKPQFDVIKAEADLEISNLNVIRSANSIKNCYVQLENAIGKKIPGNPFFVDNLEILEELALPFEKVLEEAYKNRPEVIASKVRVEANKSFVTSAWSANLPTINATGGYTWKSYTLDAKFQPSWNLGLTLSIPLFQMGTLQAGVQQARANLKSAESSNDATLQTVLLDVQQQYLSLEEAKLRIEVSKKLVKQADEALKLAEGRYNSDVGSALEVTDARVTFLNARVTFIQSLYDYHLASAKLKRAMGIIK
jgi:outer membrane protein